MNQNDMTLVIGGTGKTRRRVVERLQNLGLGFRIGSRNVLRAFDWKDRNTWSPALEGMAKACDVDWTILRCSFFSQNFSENFFLDPILTGEVTLPVRPVPEPFVAVEDIADAAIAALTQPGHSRKLYELTGPRALTFADAIGEIARATGRDIRYLSITPEEYCAAMLEAQVPQDIIDLVLYLFGTVLDGRNTPVTDDVQRALGRAPRDFTEYVQRTAASGVWGN